MPSIADFCRDWTWHLWWECTIVCRPCQAA